MRKIIEILAQLIISTTIFAGIFYAALPKYDHTEAQNTLRNHFTIMFRVQQGIGKVQNDIYWYGKLDCNISLLVIHCCN